MTPEKVRLLLTVRECVAIARREGVPLEMFLRSQWEHLPPMVGEDARVLMLGLACVEWFSEPVL